MTSRNRALAALHMIADGNAASLVLASQGFKDDAEFAREVLALRSQEPEGVEPEEENPVVGHKTLKDGSHVPLRRIEADAIMARADAAMEHRRAAMPDEETALRVLTNAYQRLSELGWRDAIYCPKDGSEFSVIEAGSSGIHAASYSGEWPSGSWWIYADGDMWPSRPILFRPKTWADELRHISAAASAHTATEENCDTCHDTGQVPVEHSGLASDGDAIIYETCPECGGIPTAPTVGKEAVAWMIVRKGCIVGRIETVESVAMSIAAEECADAVIPLYAPPDSAWRVVEELSTAAAKALHELEIGPIFKPLSCPKCGPYVALPSMTSSRGMTINDGEAGMVRCHECGHRWQSIVPNPTISELRKALDQLESLRWKA